MQRRQRMTNHYLHRYDQRLHTLIERLSHTIYTLIAIGDSAYGPLFCKQPLHLASLLSEMGARQFLRSQCLSSVLTGHDLCPTGRARKCDVAVDPEETIRQFASSLSDRVNELASQYHSKNLERWTEFLDLRATYDRIFVHGGDTTLQFGPWTTWMSDSPAGAMDDKEKEKDVARISILQIAVLSNTCTHICSIRIFPLFPLL
ncbi:hypothetical protein BT69DRAFT_1341410 [Atractiella rhizophila]|nr:hypothetical protein BT69DRAFT_1341410 [Atractiella rhizophila]